MKRFSAFILISVFIVTIALSMYKYSNRKYSVTLNNKLKCEIWQKGIEGSKSFDIDDKGNTYLAFKSKIIMIDSNRKETTLIDDRLLNIWDIIVSKNRLYVAADNSVLEYTLEGDFIKELIGQLPNNGVNKKLSMTIDSESLYVAIGTSTNSGVVNSEEEAPDVPSYDWKLFQNNYGEGKTGPFMEYGIKVRGNENIKGSNISNGSIINYNLNTAKITNYVTGVRNVDGIDFDNEGNVVVIVGGMEDYGVRAVKEDKDYIYSLKEKAWYGWPDFSGGDPITSPRFSDGKSRLEFLIKNHLTEMPYAPIYQHKSLNSLSGLAVEHDGKCLGVNTVIFADNKENYIYSLTNNRLVSVIIDLGDGSKIEKLKYFNGSIYALDSERGYVYKFYNNNVISTSVIGFTIKVFGIILAIVLLIISLIKLKANLRNK